MIIRPPSAQRSWDTYFSGDPAFKQPPTEPDPITDEYREQVAEYLAKLQAARDTGNWSALAIDGQQPTKFVMGQVDRNIWRALMDRVILPGDSPRHIGQVTLNALLFRLSIRSIVGWDKFERLPDPAWDHWVMAPAELVTQLDEIDPRIVGELGSEVFSRLRGVRPLS